MPRIEKTIIGPTCKSILVNGIGQHTTTEASRIQIYSIQVGEPAIVNNQTILQPTKECELVFTRDGFYMFADMIADLKKWFDDHPLGAEEKTRKDFTPDEHLKEWLTGDD